VNVMPPKKRAIVLPTIAARCIFIHLGHDGYGWVRLGRALMGGAT
jgi:hypothetical protein